jgi:hypothetical protein
MLLVLLFSAYPMLADWRFETPERLVWLGLQKRNAPLYYRQVGKVKIAGPTRTKQFFE